MVWHNDEITVTDGSVLPSESEIQSKIAELTAAEPMRLLREQRNQLLQQSDWMAVADRTMTQAQIDYRQALRDLPETADPQLDENGNLTNVTWPTYE
jgi:DnaJ-domain-containing protein 1